LPEYNIWVGKVNEIFLDKREARGYKLLIFFGHEQAWQELSESERGIWKSRTV
jgi:hypothetical protein